MKFMITFTGKPAHFKDALSRFLKTRSRRWGRKHPHALLAFHPQ